MKYFECFGGVMRETRDGKWVMRHETALKSGAQPPRADNSDYATAQITFWLARHGITGVKCGAITELVERLNAEKQHCA